MATRSAYIAYSPFTGTAGVDLNGQESWVEGTAAGVWKYSTEGTYAEPQYSGLTPYRWNATFSADQWAEVTFAVVPPSGRVGVCLRHQGGILTADADCYAISYVPGSGVVEVVVLVNGDSASAVLDTGAASFSNGDKISAEIEGNVIRVYKNYAGSSDTPLLTVTDTSDTYTAGYPGIYHRAAATTTRLDDFYAGDLSTGGTSVAPLAMSAYSRMRNG